MSDARAPLLPPERWAILSPLIDAALDLSPEQRAAYCDRVTPGDPALKAELEALLADGERGSSLFDRSAAEHFPDLFEGTGAALPAVLAGRFRIEREIGRGGMAVVYLARDTRHDRSVAVKVLRAEIASALGADRFLREIHTAARLLHPHILSLHDSGEAEGFLYYVMPYVEGESLRDRLRREGQLSIDDALRITREVAEALHYAHGQNVVHRDIKPENILLSGGHALVMDFGIARAISSAGGEQITQTGLVIGTPAYMPPEQASANVRIDGRADTYALACVLYEMLASHPPFLGGTAQQVVARHVLDPVPPLRTVRPGVPQALEQVIVKALAKSPADRFPTTAGFSAACQRAARTAEPAGRLLRRAWPAIGALGLLVAGYVVLRPAPTVGSGALAGGEPRSVAVLALRNVGGDPANEAFSDGISEEISTTLSRVSGLAVKAPRSAFSFKGKHVTLREIGRQLGVRYLVDGSVQRAADRLRVRVELVLAGSDSTVWSAEYDRPSGDVFAIQDDIARAIAGELRVHLAPGAAGTVARRSTASPEAHDLYLQGRYFFERRDSASLRRAEEYFERAIAADSQYALAYAGLSDVYSHRSVFGFSLPRESFPLAKRLALNALALDSTLPEVHSSLGFIAQFYEWDWPAARRRFDEAMRLGPSLPSGHLWRAWHMLAVGDTAAAIEDGRRAVALDPFSPLVNTRMITFLFYGRRYEEGLRQAQRVRELDSTFFQLTVERARLLAFSGRCPEALDGLPDAPQEHASVLAGIRGYIYSRCGRRAGAEMELDALGAQLRAGRIVSHYGMAVIHAGLGATDAALAELERALARREWAMFMLEVEPVFESLRKDPRFDRLVDQVGL